MSTQDLITKAHHFATQAHSRIEQRRAQTGRAHDLHLKNVVDLVRSVSDDPEMVSAAWLHDTVGDTSATLEDIERAFGQEVAELLADLTEVSKPGDGDRAARWVIELEHTAQASQRAKTVKMADIIATSREMRSSDPRFARVYLSEATALLEVLQDGDTKLLGMARKAIQKSADTLDISLEGYPIGAQEDTEPSAPLAAAQPRVMRLFTDAFSAQDVAEPLRSFDEARPLEEIASIMESHSLAVVGVNHDGLTKAYLARPFEGDGRCGAMAKQITRRQEVEGDATLTEVIHVLTHHDFCFVTLLGEVNGVVSRSDIQKPVVRMWLFGIISMFEMNLVQQIRAHWPEDDWSDLLSEGRLSKAKELREQRLKRHQVCDLLDCLQLSDKTQILTQAPEKLAAWGFSSRGAAKRVIRELESLRNNLAHSQDIVTHDWASIVRISHRIEEMAGDTRG